MKTQFYLPVAMYASGPNLHTGPNGPRYYATEESAKRWRDAHGMGHLWRILEMTLEDDKPPAVRWCE